ncbi:MAG: hypothetical protein KBS81_09730, partial [Spirochaetales bacterium]|nr:hypothetical protein [Candidatus Physcosoma equi]
MLRRSLAENLRGRGLDAAVDEFVLDESGRLASFSIVLGEKRLVSSVPVERLEEEIRNMLFYEESLKMEGETLDYVWDTSFSFLPDESYQEGETLRLVDTENAVRGLFYVDKVY